MGLRSGSAVLLHRAANLVKSKENPTHEGVWGDRHVSCHRGTHLNSYTRSSRCTSAFAQQPKPTQLATARVGHTRGKRTAFITLPPITSTATLPNELQKLIEGSDVFSQAYRSGGLSARGLSAEEVQALRPGSSTLNSTHLALLALGQNGGRTTR